MVASASPARATTCTYGITYHDPYIHGPCFVDAIEGCPIHLVMPHAPPPVALSPIVFRNGEVVTVAATTALVGSLAPTIMTIDYSSCDCHRQTFAMEFDELALTLTGARGGDVVSVAGRDITIGPAAACAPPVWPTQFDVQLGGCDVCPVDPDESSFGCSAAGPAGYSALALVAIGAVARRRRTAVKKVARDTQ